jgi:outer membrane protein
MLMVSTSSSKSGVTLKVEGRLSGPWVGEFRSRWSTDRENYQNQTLMVDLTNLTFIDDSGKGLLMEICASGGRLIGSGLMTKSLIEEITQAVTSPQPAAAGTKSGVAKGLAVIILLSALALPRLHAQQGAPVRLTLQEAIQLALKQNPQVQIAALNLAQSEQDKEVGRSALRPQIGIRTSEGVQRFNLDAFIGKPLPGTPQHAGPFQTFQSAAGFTLPIFDLTLWRRLEAARHTTDATAAGEKGVREQIILLVVSQYLGNLRAAADVRAVQSRVELAQALYDQAADLQQHGVGTGLDTLRANVQLQNEKQRLIQAQTQMKTSTFALARLLNIDPAQSLELTDEVRFFETPGIEVTQSIEQAYAARPELKALEAREQAVLSHRKAAGDERLPTVTLNGFWGYQGISLPTSIPAYTFQATLDVPLYTGGRIRAEIAKADIELKKVAREKEELRNQVALEVKTSVEQLEAAKHEVDVANLGVKLAEEEVAQSRDRFQAGVANNIEVVSAQDAFARANDNQIAALYRYNQSRADLAHATGQMETLYEK